MYVSSDHFRGVRDILSGAKCFEEHNFCRLALPKISWKYFNGLRRLA